MVKNYVCPKCGSPSGWSRYVWAADMMRHTCSSDKCGHTWQTKADTDGAIMEDE
jgi:hypothetical protein